MQRLDLLVTRHFPRLAGKMRFAFGEQPWPTTGSKRDACCPRLSAKIDNMLVSLMRIAPKHFPRQAGKMRFAAGEQPLITIDWKLDA